MSKGNINYKYLKRRKSWFRRNLPLVILIAIAAVVIIAGSIIAGIMLSHSGKDKKIIKRIRMSRHMSQICLQKRQQ